MGRGTKNGEGGRWLTRLPLLWQWLLVFAFTVMVLVSDCRAALPRPRFLWLQGD